MSWRISAPGGLESGCFALTAKRTWPFGLLCQNIRVADPGEVLPGPSRFALCHTLYVLCSRNHLEIAVTSFSYDFVSVYSKYPMSSGIAC